MSSPPFTIIPSHITELINPYSSTTTKEPIIYKIPVTYLQNLSSGSMIIDSCSNIIIQARNKHVIVNNKMGIGMDPSSAYSLHVSGDTCISGNITSNNFTDLSSKYYSLLSSVNELSNNNYTLNTTITTISNSLYNILSDLIFGTGYCGTITFVNNSIYDISFRVTWYPSYLSQEYEYTPNYSSLNSIDGSTNVIISNTNRLANRNSNFFLNIISNYNSFVNKDLSDYINFNNNLVTSISSEIFENDKKHRITIKVSNGDNIENIPITFNYNPLYKGFYGTFGIGNKTPDSKFDYSYNYLSIIGSNVNSTRQTLSGSDFSNILINANSRLANQNTRLNLSLLIYNGYDISVGALPGAIIGISNNILTSSRIFDTSNILYNYNIIPLSSYLVNGTIGLSFEMYKTGFFGTFELGNKTPGSKFDYSYNYLSISGSNVTSIFTNLTPITQISPPSVSRPNLGGFFGCATKFAKTTNTTFKAVIGSPDTNEVRIWSGTAISNEFILLNNIPHSGSVGNIVGIDNAGQYIVSGGYAISGLYGGTIWSTTPPYNSAIITYPFSGSDTQTEMFVHISGNGQRVFVGSSDFNNIYAFSRTDLSLTQIGGVITVTGLTVTGLFNQNSFTKTGFASDNSANYLITSAFYDNYARGYVILYRFNSSTWVQTHGFSGTSNNDYFGYSIDMNCGSGIVCCAGAPNAPIPYVKIYKRNTTTDNWTEDQILYGTVGSGFGTSVSFNETGSSLYITTKDAEIFNYTRPNNSAQFTLTFTIPSQEPTYEAYGQSVSTNSSGTQFILVKSSDYDGFVYYFDTSPSNIQTLSGQALTTNSISSVNRVASQNTPLNLSLLIYNGYDISVGALPSSIIGISNNSLTNYSRIFDTSNILYNYNIIPLSSVLLGGTIGLSFEMYKTGFFGTFELGNKTPGSKFDYSYNYLSISRSNVNSGLLTLSGQELSNNSISSANRLAYANSSLNFGLVIYDGYDISVGALPGAIIGISDNILTSSRIFDTSNILYNYNIIPLSSYLVNGTIVLSFEMYKTGFFGTFELGNKTPGSKFDYSYNYLSISGSNVNSGLLTLSGQELSNNSISRANRLAYADSSLNLSLVIYNGYDISVGALPAAIIGISNNILTNYSKTFDPSNILYNYNIIPLSSNLVNGTIGLSFEMYKTGFFGSIIVNNNLGYTIDYSYNYITLGGSTIFSPSTSINNTSSNTRTISGELRLSYETSQIEMNIRTSYLVEDISYTIGGGTINNIVVSTSSPYKYLNFNILPNVNNLVNGIIFVVTYPPPVTIGWFGTFIVSNVIASGSDSRYFNAYLAFNNDTISNTIQINGNQSHTFTIQGQDGLPLPTSTLQLKVTAESGTTDISLSAYDGFSITNFTNNPPTQENTLHMIVNSNKLINGVLSASFTITYPPPPSGWSGTITFNRTAGGGEPSIFLRTDTQVITLYYDYDNESDPTFSVSLTTEQSYVEIAIDLATDWEIDSKYFSPNLGNPYEYFGLDYAVTWYRYAIPIGTSTDLTYNFSTLFDD